MSDLDMQPPQSNHDNPTYTDPLWTVQEVSTFLRLKPQTIRAMARRGQLPGVKIGRMWRFNREEIESLVQDSP